jgi:[acyl-carrier-protein] S-malonyltransferase
LGRDIRPEESPGDEKCGGRAERAFYVGANSSLTGTAEAGQSERNGECTKDAYHPAEHRIGTQRTEADRQHENARADHGANDERSRHPNAELMITDDCHRLASHETGRLAIEPTRPNPRRHRQGSLMRAFIFPGQGSQSVGMGAALAGASRPARDVFDEVDEALGPSLFRLMRDGPDEELKLTENAQPAIMANSIAVFRTMGLQLPDVADFVAGHSLGEYSALCAAGSFDLATTAKLLKLRGQAMQQAVPVGVGAMAALLGADLALAQKIADAAAQGEVCTVANDNDPSQVVISGHKGAIDRAIDMAKEMGAKRAVLLPVSAPFHCPLMQPAAEAMRDALGYVVVTQPALPVFANVTAQPETDPDTIRNQLVEQVTGMVRWRESVANMFDAGVQEFVEIGGKVLGPMVKRIAPDATVTSVVSIEDVEALAKEIA